MARFSRARHTILTHFSQRYPSVPEIAAPSAKGTEEGAGGAEDKVESSADGAESEEVVTTSAEDGAESAEDGTGPSIGRSEIAKRAGIPLFAFDFMTVALPEMEFLPALLYPVLVRVFDDGGDDDD